MRLKTCLCGTAALAALCIVTPALSADSVPGKIETIVVTASPVAAITDQYATRISAVSRDDILQSGGDNLADALQTVPGVSGSGFAAGASRPVIRGFGADRVRVLEDGIDSFDVSEIGPDHGVPIDPLSAQSIEVVRGPATLRYGSQAIGGVVNAINNRVPMHMPEKQIAGELSSSFATSANTLQGSGLIDGSIGENFAFHADAFGRRSGDYNTPLGKQINSFFRGDGYSGGGSYFFGDASRIGAAVIHYDAKYGVPSDTTYIDMKQTKELFRSSFALGMGALQTLTVEGGYGDYAHSEIAPDGTIASTFKDKGADVRSEALFGRLGWFSSAALGMQYQHRDFSALGEGADYLLPATTQTFAGFAFAEAPLTKGLKLQIAGRVDNVDIDGTPASGVPARLGFTPLSGSAGLVYQPGDALKLGLTFTSSARAPALAELFARGPHDGPETFETGDPNLRMERANSLEANVHYMHERFHFDGALWGAKFQHYIYGKLTGRMCDESGLCSFGGPGDLRELHYVQQSAKYWGLEGKASYTLSQSHAGLLQADFQADLVRATLGGGGNVPRIPPYHVGGGLSWTSDMFDAGFLLRYAGRQNRVGPYETPTKGYVDLDAHLAWRPFKNHPGVEFALTGHNLTNVVQRNAVSLNKDLVVAPGRDIRLVVTTAF